MTGDAADRALNDPGLPSVSDVTRAEEVLEIFKCRQSLQDIAVYLKRCRLEDRKLDPLVGDLAEARESLARVVVDLESRRQENIFLREKVSSLEQAILQKNTEILLAQGRERAHEGWKDAYFILARAAGVETQSAPVIPSMKEGEAVLADAWGPLARGEYANRGVIVPLPSWIEVDPEHGQIRCLVCSHVTVVAATDYDVPERFIERHREEHGVVIDPEYPRAWRCEKSKTHSIAFELERARETLRKTAEGAVAAVTGTLSPLAEKKGPA